MNNRTILNSKIFVAIGLSVILISSTQVYSAYGLSTWAFRMGGPGTDDVFRGIEQASDGGYIIAGTTNSFGKGKNDVWIIKLDEESNVVWQKTYGGGGGDSARSIKQTSDGGFVVAGQTHSFSNGKMDIWVIKFGSNGSPQWQKSYGGPGNEMAHAIDPTSDGGYVVAGYTEGFGASSKDYFVIKLDSAGAIEWQKRFGGTGEEVV
ncbi:MAG: hypothetical protein MN733_14610, partial [Nitrososphaera sp.]|nr:hypothetical protein [Nitrososphaera sp.]